MPRRHRMASDSAARIERLLSKAAERRANQSAAFSTTLQERLHRLDAEARRVQTEAGERHRQRPRETPPRKVPPMGEKPPTPPQQQRPSPTPPPPPPPPPAQRKAEQPKAPAPGDPTNLSNVERFFYDEEVRRRAKEERDRRRQTRQERSGEDAIRTAKKVWERMQRDVEAKWASYKPTQQQQQQQGHGRQSQTYSCSASASDKWATTPVRDLKALLRGLGVPDSTMLCMERGEIIALLEKKSADQAAKQERAGRQRAEEERNDRLRSKIVCEVDEWRKNRTLRWMLNSLNSAAPGQAPYLPANASFETVCKVYKRALLKIHPDKHIGTTLESWYRAEETFKAVNESFNQYKALHELRSYIKS
ncbi:hypothetical protein PBRA_008552 [Plasmodiophora brassicae]|nr:hypothetical protein PBRA_008552 [Plasmodiophora brassicae]